MQVFKTVTVAGLAIQSMNPNSEVDQMPSHRQSLDIANTNAFLSNFQRSALRTLKFFALIIQINFSLQHSNLLCWNPRIFCVLWSMWSTFCLLGFRLSKVKTIRQISTFPSIQIFKAYFDANRGSNQRRPICIFWNPQYFLLCYLRRKSCFLKQKKR